jgi:hypothetical protein
MTKDQAYEIIDQIGHHYQSKTGQPLRLYIEHDMSPNNNLYISISASTMIASSYTSLSFKKTRRADKNDCPALFLFMDPPELDQTIQDYLNENFISHKIIYLDDQQ